MYEYSANLARVIDGDTILTQSTLMVAGQFWITPQLWVKGGGQVAFAGGGVIVKCPARNITLKGDSAERYPDHNQMIGKATNEQGLVGITVPPDYPETPELYAYASRIAACRARDSTDSPGATTPVIISRCSASVGL